jgi:hypothetical protein
VVPNPAEVSETVGGEGTLRGVPFSPGSRASRTGTDASEVARSFADILARAGFADGALLDLAIGSWQRLIDELRPEAAVCEHSPFFCLAARGRSLPVLVSGHGFVLPPPYLADFPPLRGAEDDRSADRLLEVVNSVTRRRGEPALDQLPALFAGTAHVVTGLALLDPYAEWRREPPVGPPGLDIRRFDDEPRLLPDDLFGYFLGDAAVTLPLLHALAGTRLGGRIFVRRGTASQRDALVGSRLVWLERPEPASGLLRRSRIVVHHASMLTSEEAALAGRPQVLVPLYLEHLLTARALGRAGARVVRAGMTQSVIGELVRGAATDAEAVQAARAFARAAETSRAAIASELLSRVL